MKKITYKKAGVDIDKAEEFIKKIKRFIHSDLKAFSATFSLANFLNYKKPLLISSTDGVGTKLLIAQMLNIHNTVGIDLVAMNVNDIICTGAKPLFFLDYIASGKLDNDILLSIMNGIYKGVKESNSVLIGGETAEMPDMYKKNEYDLAGFAVGIVDKDDLINGKKIKNGDVVIGLASNGIHSNGYSLVRKIFKKKEIIKYKKELLKPTKIYVKSVLNVINKFKNSIRGIAHITGGAWYLKATKILPEGLSFYIEKESWEIPEIFKVIEKKGKLDFYELYRTFNMGIGLILVVKKEDSDKVYKYISRFEKSYIIGEVKKGAAKIIFK